MMWNVISYFEKRTENAGAWKQSADNRNGLGKYDLNNWYTVFKKRETSGFV